MARIIQHHLFLLNSISKINVNIYALPALLFLLNDLLDDAD